MVKTQPGYIGIPSILEKLGSWDYHQGQRQLWDRARLSLGDTPCGLWMSDLEACCCQGPLESEWCPDIGY